MNKTIRGCARQVIYEVFLRCLCEYQTGKLLANINDVYKRTAIMTGKSENTIRKIAREGEINDGKFITPAKHRMGRPKKELEESVICAIRQKIHFFYTVKHEVPTLRKIHPILKRDFSYDGSREHLRKLLPLKGFRYQKCHEYQKSRQPKSSAIIEKTSIADKRERYLRIIMANRNLPKELQKNIVYVDDSCIYSSYKEKQGKPNKGQGILQNNSNGNRWIILHAGSEEGFVTDALLIIRDKNSNEDKSKINPHIFKKWVLEKLVPNLTEPSIVVMDDAPYHLVKKNKAPTSVSKEKEIRQWLEENHIVYDHSLRKPSLLMLAKNNAPAPIYEIDDILETYNHVVLRLPPFHWDLNPMEHIWSLIKQEVRNKGATDIKQFTELISKITKQDWKNSCDHVKKIERQYYESGSVLYEEIEKLVIAVDEDSESDTESDSEDESMSPEPGSYSTDVTKVEEDESMSDVEYLDFNLLS